MAFNYERLKADFREAAQSRGIDVERGSSEFQACLIRAEINTELHHSRMRQSVRDAAVRQLAQAKRGARWEEGRGFLTEDYQAIDELLVARAESADWWDHGQMDNRTPDVAPVRTNARNEKAARFKAVGAMMHVVLEEKPTQAAMKKSYFPKRKKEVV